MAVTHEYIAKRVDELKDRVERVEDEFASVPGIISEMAGMRREVTQALKPLEQMQKDIAATRGVVEAYDTVKNNGRFVMWLGGLVAVLAASWAAVSAAARGWFL